VFAVLGGGEVFGELAVLQENAFRSADAEALGETECYVLEKHALEDLTAGSQAGHRTVTTGVMAPDAQERNAKFTQVHSGPILIDRNAEQSAATSGAPAGQHARIRPGSLQP
jgi:hypothetical protein